MREYTYEYNRLFNPAEPAPFVDVGLSTVPNDDRPFQASAQIDSGSDVSAVPLSILEQIGAGKQRDRTMIGMSGRPQTVEIHEIYITLAEQTFPVDVIGLAHLQEVVIGRDILNRFTVELHGLDRITIIPVYD